MAARASTAVPASSGATKAAAGARREPSKAPLSHAAHEPESREPGSNAACSESQAQTKAQVDSAAAPIRAARLPARRPSSATRAGPASAAQPRQSSSVSPVASRNSQFA